MRTLIIKWYLWLLTIIAVVWLFFAFIDSREEVKRLSTNQTALNTPKKVFKTKSGKSAVKVQAVTYTKKELKKYNPELVADAKDAGIRVSDIQSVADIGFVANIDTVVPTTKTDTSVCFNYNDSNFTVVGCYYPGTDSANVAAAYRDSLQILVTRVPKQFLFFKWGCKAINLNIISSNKSTEFRYAKYVELKK